MVLSVLSGEKPVSEAIVEAEMTRAHYYHLEKRAVLAMLRALMPGGEGSDGEAVTLNGKVKDLEEKVVRLEREKRRTERLLYLTRSVVKPGPLKLKVGRPRKNLTTTATTSSRKKRPRKTTETMGTTGSTSASTPTKDGGSAP
jgi:hypothetical protein